MGDNIWTAKNAAEYVAEALAGSGETTDDYDIDAIVRTLYRQANTHDLRDVDVELFWSVVWANQRIKKV
jgi:hypothetical protein